eukprot:1153923-Pelagomonas_calceolata.AAC.2
MARLVEGMGSIDSPTHTKKDCVESDLNALKLIAQSTVMLSQTGCAAYIHMYENGKQETGAGVYCPLTDSKVFVEPNNAGITITIRQAELAAIAAAITHSYSHIVSDSLTSLRQIRKQLKSPARSAGIAGNECADAIAKYQANEANNSVADTGILSANILPQIPAEIHFHNYFGLPGMRKESMVQTFPQLLHPLPKLSTSLIFKTPPNPTCIQIMLPHHDVTST